MKDWGGVPRVISEKSDESVMRNDMRGDTVDKLTLCVQEVVDQDVVTSLGLDRGLLEHHLLVSVRANAHVLLAQSVNVGIDVVGTLRWVISRELRLERSNTRNAYQLFAEGNLVELQLVDLSRGTAQQHRGCQ